MLLAKGNICLGLLKKRFYLVKVAEKSRWLDQRKTVEQETNLKSRACHGKKLLSISILSTDYYFFALPFCLCCHVVNTKKNLPRSVKKGFIQLKWQKEADG